MSNEIVEVANSDVTQAAIESLASGRATVFSTIKGNDHAARLAVFNAVTDSEPIADNLGKKINLVNVVVQSVEIADEQTGELNTVPRTVLIDENGKAFHAMSTGVFRAVETLLGILGEPSDWPGALPVVASREGKGTQQYFTLRPAK